MAEKEGESWVSTLREFNRRRKGGEGGKNPLQDGGDTEEDKKLLEEYYVKFKGEARNKYSVIPKFYSKVP